MLILKIFFNFGIETFGEFVTEKFIDKLNDKIIAIKEMPGRGQLNEFLPKGLRFLKVDNHYIIYEYSDSLKLIRILRISTYGSIFYTIKR